MSTKPLPARKANVKWLDDLPLIVKAYGRASSVIYNAYCPLLIRNWIQAISFPQIKVPEPSTVDIRKLEISKRSEYCLLYLSSHSHDAHSQRFSSNYSFHLVLSSFDTSSSKQYIKFWKCVLLLRYQFFCVLKYHKAQIAKKAWKQWWIELNSNRCRRTNASRRNWVIHSKDRSPRLVPARKPNWMGKTVKFYHKFKIFAIVSWFVLRKQ